MSLTYVPHHLLLLILVLLNTCRSATIGDGRTSLISGRPIDYRLGSCVVDGRTYASETAVPRSEPCHYCLCYRGKIDCYWKRCARIPPGCQVMSLEDNCNPSLYICDIPEKARNAPTYGAPRTTTYTPSTAAAAASTVQFSIRPARQPVIPPSRELTPPERQFIEPPSRHLTPPQQSIQSRSLGDSNSDPKGHRQQPSQFSLKMKQKMRFRRSSAIETSHQQRLPYNIEEDFPIQLIENHIRSKRAINISGTDNHHHHQDHYQEEDRGCRIMGVRYELGQVVGVATDVCQECRCAAQSLFCSPKCCFKPAPLQLASSDMIRFLQPSTNNVADDPYSEGPQHPLYYLQSEFA